MDTRVEQILVETERHRITGSLRLPADGYRSRMSDFLNSQEREFIALTDVTIESSDGSGSPIQREFAAVSTRHIIFATSFGEVPAAL